MTRSTKMVAGGVAAAAVLATGVIRWRRSRRKPVTLPGTRIRSGMEAGAAARESAALIKGAGGSDQEAACEAIRAADAKMPWFLWKWAPPLPAGC